MLENIKGKTLWLIGYIDYKPFDLSCLKNIKSYNQIIHDGNNLSKKYIAKGSIKENSAFLIEMDNKSYCGAFSLKTGLKNITKTAESNLSKLYIFNPAYIIPYAFKTKDFFKDCPLIEQQLKRRELLKDYFLAFLNDLNDNFNPLSYEDIVCLSGKIHIYDYLRPDFIEKNLKDLTINSKYFSN